MMTRYGIVIVCASLLMTAMVTSHLIVPDPDDEPQRHYAIGIPIIPLSSSPIDVAVNGSCKNGGCDQWLSRCIQQGIHGSLKRFCDCSYSAVINFQCTPDYLYCGHMVTPPETPQPHDDHDDNDVAVAKETNDTTPVPPPHGCSHTGCDDWVATCIHRAPGYKNFCACFQSANIKFNCAFDSHCGHD